MNLYGFCFILYNSVVFYIFYHELWVKYKNMLCKVASMGFFGLNAYEVLVEVDVSVESGNSETGEGTTNLFLNPVQKDGQWYLTLLDTHAEGVGVYHHNE